MIVCLTCGLACDDGEVCPRCGLRLKQERWTVRYPGDFVLEFDSERDAKAWIATASARCELIPPAVLRERAELLKRERERWMEHEGPA